MRFLTYEEQLFLNRFFVTLDRLTVKAFCKHMLSPEYRERNFITNSTLSLVAGILEKIDEADFYEALETELTK
jgi:hypothetical protein